ncbi:MAG: caspase family protein, partial [Mucilaginibacter sp.]
QTIIDKYNFDPANIDTVFNKSRKDILVAVSNKLQKLSPKDNLVLFYGGHGYFVESANMAYWVPLNAETEFEYISNTDINNLLSGCEARHILVMADACFSGAMRGGESVPAKYEYKTKSRQLLTSGGTEPVPGVSVYVKTLLEQLDMNEDKYISARDLQTRIYPGIKNAGKTECTLTPLQVSGSQGGQFYFKKK